MSKTKDTTPRSAKLLADWIKDEPELLNPNRKDAKELIDKMAENFIKHYPTPALVSEAGIYYLVIAFLGAVSTLAIIGTLILSIMSIDKDTINIPDVITALGSAAIGALAGLIAPSPVNKS